MSIYGRNGNRSQQSVRSNLKMITILIVIVTLILFILSIFVVPIITQFNKNTYTLTVTDKDRIVDDSDSKYLVFTVDENGNSRVLENTDDIFKFKFNSSDLHAKIEVGKTYTFHVYGFRIPFLSSYENIISFEEVNDNEKIR